MFTEMSPEYRADPSRACQHPSVSFAVDKAEPGRSINTICASGFQRVSSGDCVAPVEAKLAGSWSVRG